MKIAIGADHGGYALKAELGERLKKEGHQLLDVGSTNAEPSDYPESYEPSDE